jgi:hypothetical protein
MKKTAVWDTMPNITTSSLCKERYIKLMVTQTAGYLYSTTVFCYLVHGEAQEFHQE